MTCSMAIDVKIRKYNSHLDDREYIDNWNQLQEIADISNENALAVSSYGELYDDSDTLWMIVNDGAPVGCINVTFNLQHQSAEIGIIIGERHKRRNGLGKMALSQIIELIRTIHKMTTAIAYVHESNHAARRLFESAGFIAGSSVWFKQSRAIIYKITL